MVGHGLSFNNSVLVLDCKIWQSASAHLGCSSIVWLSHKR